MNNPRTVVIAIANERALSFNKVFGPRAVDVTDYTGDQCGACDTKCAADLCDDCLALFS